jgi:hypothetical protein
MVPHFIDAFGTVDRSPLMGFWLLVILFFFPAKGRGGSFNRTFYSKRVSM